MTTPKIILRNKIVPRFIYQDDSLLVLDKPPGLVVDPAQTVKEKTLVDWLQNYYDTSMYPSEDIPERMGLVHRLDKDTSGIILVAKTKVALEDLQKQFQERVVKKEYLALVHGLIMESGKIDASIARNPENREKFTVISPGRRTRPLEQSPPSRWAKGFVALQGEALEAREAVTEYEPVKNLQFTIYNLQTIFSDFNKIQMRKLERMNYNQFTLVKCHPQTGRTHQIRVHLKYIGHPIVSDDKYGGRKMVRLDKRWCPRMFLHAAKIGFNHPKRGEWVELESPLPEDLEKALTFLSSRT